jgi:predicted transcriptional regulator
MNRIFTSFITMVVAALLITGSAFAMEGHDKDSSEKIGELFHESMVDGYMLSYYLMDLRDQKGDDKSSDHSSHEKKDMDKPHHIMVYIMDKDHKPVIEGKVGFMINDANGNPQKAMAMYMSKGFGITADMKKKGVYSITTKALLGSVKLMDKFTYEMK